MDENHRFVTDEEKTNRAVEGHYNGRRIIADVDGEERIFRFKKDEMPFICDEDEMIELIEQRVLAEATEK